MLTYLVVSVGQALIVTLGNMFLLGVYVKNPVYSVLFAVLVALAFMMIVYTLVALFGTVGKGIAIIILVLSISGGGETTRSRYLGSSSKQSILGCHLPMRLTCYVKVLVESIGQMRQEISLL